MFIKKKKKNNLSSLLFCIFVFLYVGEHFEGEGCGQTHDLHVLSVTLPSSHPLPTNCGLCVSCLKKLIVHFFIADNF